MLVIIFLLATTIYYFAMAKEYERWTNYYKEDSNRNFQNYMKVLKLLNKKKKG